MRAEMRRRARELRLSVEADVILALRLKNPERFDRPGYFFVGKRKCLICAVPEPSKPGVLHECVCRECRKNFGKVCYGSASGKRRRHRHRGRGLRYIGSEMEDVECRMEPKQPGEICNVCGKGDVWESTAREWFCEVQKWPHAAEELLNSTIIISKHLYKRTLTKQVVNWPTK